MYRSFSALPQERANYWRGEAYVFKGVGGSSAGSHPFPSPGRLRLRRFEGGLPEEEGFLKDPHPPFRRQSHEQGDVARGEGQGAEAQSSEAGSH
jgi:hypothetical protein